MPAGLCKLSNLVELNIDGDYSNIDCYAYCLTDISNDTFIANLNVCPISVQETAVCDFVAGTNIASVSPVDIWACSYGYANSPPCEWNGVVCDLSLNITSITLQALGMTGSIIFKYSRNIVYIYYILGSVSSSLGMLTALTNLNLQVNSISGK